MACSLSEKSCEAGRKLRMGIAVWLISTLYVLMFAVAACSSSNDDLGALSQSLEDRLTDALNFDGGKTKTGKAPAGQSDDTAPQIKETDVPAQLFDSLDFAVWISSDYSNPEKVTHAIVRVKNASKYIVVAAALAPSTDKLQMILRGSLKKDEKLAGKSFDIDYALQTEDGQTGAYVTKKLKIADTAPECSEGLCCNGGNWIEENAQCMRNDDLSCTEESCDAEHACIASQLSETCLIDNVCYVPYDLNPSNECEKCWPEENAEDWSYFNSAACNAGSGPESGYCQNGVCIPLTPDGDAEDEADLESETSEGIDEDPESESAAIWNDDQNGLAWEIEAGPDALNLSDCTSRCTGLALGDLSGWHIPTISELRSLVHNCDATVTGGICAVSDSCTASGECRDESCNGCPGSGACFIADELTDSCGIYLSATLSESDVSSVWSVDFNSASINLVLLDEVHLCRCVRSLAR